MVFQMTRSVANRSIIESEIVQIELMKNELNMVEVIWFLLLSLYARKPEVESQPLDLSLLRPLWSLYCKMTDESRGGITSESGFMPSSVLALTELFLHAEDLAIVSILCL